MIENKDNLNIFGKKKEPVSNAFPDIIANSEKHIQAEVIDYSFISSNNIEDMEDGLKRAIALNQKITLSICLGFYFIGERHLYQKLGYKNFSEYLTNQTVVSPRTAWEYNYIGEKYVLFQKELQEINFTSNDGFQKLKFIPKNIDHFSKKEKIDIFDKLKNLSVRQYKSYISTLKKKKTTVRTVKKSGSIYSLEEIENLALTEFNNSKAVQKELNNILAKKSTIEKQELIEIVEMGIGFFIEKVRDLSKKNKVKIKK